MANASHLLVGAIASACLLLVAGCNGGADDETPAPGTTTTAQTAPAEVDFASLTGDPAAGEKVFMMCAACHSVEEGVNKVGPSLHGVVGRKAGALAGFAYSDANKSSDLIWTPEELFVYLADPRATLPGNRMAFGGLKDPQKRADLIAYLQTQS